MENTAEVEEKKISQEDFQKLESKLIKVNKKLASIKDSYFLEREELEALNVQIIESQLQSREKEKNLNMREEELLRQKETISQKEGLLELREARLQEKEITNEKLLEEMKETIEELRREQRQGNETIEKFKQETLQLKSRIEQINKKQDEYETDLLAKWEKLKTIEKELNDKLISLSNEQKSANQAPPSTRESEETILKRAESTATNLPKENKYLSRIFQPHSVQRLNPEKALLEEASSIIDTLREDIRHNSDIRGLSLRFQGGAYRVFGKLFSMHYQFTYEELKEKIEKSSVPQRKKRLVKKFCEHIIVSEYGGKKISERQLRLLVDLFEKIVFFEKLNQDKQLEKKTDFMRRMQKILKNKQEKIKDLSRHFFKGQTQVKSKKADD